MNSTMRRLLAILLVVGVCLLPRWAQAQTAPGAKVLFQRSLQALLSLHSVHTEAALSSDSPQYSVRLRLSGDCAANLATGSDGKLQIGTLSARLYLHGRIRSGTQSRHVHAHLIVLVQQGSKTQGWENSTRTHGVWQVEDWHHANPALAELDELCLPLIAPTYLHGPSVPLHNLGSATINGTATWHLRGKKDEGTVEQDDFYLDQQSLYWVRWVLRQSDPEPSHGTWRWTWSAFKTPVTIEPPLLRT